MVIVGLDNVVQRTVFVDQGRIIVEQESASPAIAGTWRSLQVTHSFFLHSGCTMDDINILGGDLPSNQGGGGFFADYDDNCAKECEDNPRCL